jgi:hypothetical protein
MVVLALPDELVAVTTYDVLEVCVEGTPEITPLVELIDSPAGN